MIFETAWYTARDLRAAGIGHETLERMRAEGVTPYEVGQGGAYLYSGREVGEWIRRNAVRVKSKQLSHKD